MEKVYYYPPEVLAKLTLDVKNIYDQMKSNIAFSLLQDKKKLELEKTPRKKPIAIVGLGPSLAHTWHKLSDYEYIMTTSGAHQYLLSRSILPTWHAEVDYQAHKIELMGKPDNRIQYLIASTCHPTIFEHLKQQDITVWHPLLNPIDELKDYDFGIPDGEYLINGGANVVLRAMFLSNFLGFNSIELFGFDLSYPPDHPNEYVIDHPSSRDKIKRIKLSAPDGTIYHTTEHMHDYAQQFFFLKKVLEWHGMNIICHGDGMIADLINKNLTLDDRAKDSMSTPIAIMNPKKTSLESQEFSDAIISQKIK